MNLNTLLEYLLKEATLAPEAPKDAPLGQYLFAPERSDTPEPKEPNTSLENTLKQRLTQHYTGSGNSKDIEKSISTLINLKNKGMYQKLLNPPSGLAYRFIPNLTPEEASTLFLNNLPVKDITAEPNKAFYVSNIGIIKNPSIRSTVRIGKSLLSSWTVKPTSPNFDDFIYTQNHTVVVLLVADISSNNFIMNPKTLGKVAVGLHRRDLIEQEQEVIAYGPVNVLEAAAIYKSERANSSYNLIANAPYSGFQTFSEPTKAEEFKEPMEYVNDRLRSTEKNLPRRELKESKEPMSINC